jgi:hypothetical protein
MTTWAMICENVNPHTLYSARDKHILLTSLHRLTGLTLPLLPFVDKSTLYRVKKKYYSTIQSQKTTETKQKLLPSHTAFQHLRPHHIRVLA